MAPTVIDKSVFDSGGKTIVSLAPNNNHLCVVNKNGLCKILQTNAPEQEPDVVEIANDVTSVSSISDEMFVVTTFKGDTFSYRINNSKETLLARFVLPMRDCTVIHSGKAVVFGGDELELHIVEISNADKTKIKTEDQISQLSYSPQTNILAVSLVNGSVQFFSMNSLEPKKVHELKGHIVANTYNDLYKDKILNSMHDSIDKDDFDSDDDDEYKVKDSEFCEENRICTRASWHPNGMVFALPCNDFTIKVFSIKDYDLQKTLLWPDAVNKSHLIDLKMDTLHGNYIAAINLDNRLVVWDWRSSEVVYNQKLKQSITNITWKVQEHSNMLDIILGTWSGGIVTIHNLVESSATKQPSGAEQNLLEKTNLFVQSEAEEEREEGDNDIDDENLFTQEDGDNDQNSKKRYHFDDEEDFIDDDDGAGYVSAKRQQQTLAEESIYNSGSLYRLTNKSRYRYKPMSPGGTPFGSSDRRYLTMNNIGYVVTVRNNEQYSITVSFFDLGRFNEYHFEDLFGYDVCCLTERGALFAQSKIGQIHFRSHNSLNANWTKMIPLQYGERITAVGATPKKIIVGTSFGYLRTFNQYGIALGIEKMTPIVALTAQEYKIFTVHYSEFHGILYSLFEQTPKKSKYYQRESTLPITMPRGDNISKDGDNSTFLAFNTTGIKSLFFSSYGDPCIFGSDNVLLILSKWRTTMESRWIPVLDSNMEIWKMSGGKNSSNLHVWPLGVVFDTLNCILVKGKNIWPEFPLPIPSEMDLSLPILVKSQLLQENESKRKIKSAAQLEEEQGNEEAQDGKKNDVINVPVNIAAEEEFLRSKILSQLLMDMLENDGELYGNENELLASLAAVHDKSLLRLFAVACTDQNTEKALSIAQEIKQDKALNLAVKISERAELVSLVSKINEIREARFEQQMNAL